MKKHMRILGVCLILSGVFLGCQSKSESAGDSFLKAGDPVNALQQYEAALQQGSVSEGFYSNYTRAYLLVMQIHADEDPGSMILDALKDTVVNVMRLHPNTEVGAQAATVLFEVGEKRLNMGTPSSEEGAFQFFKAAASLPGKSADIDSKFAAAREKYVAGKLKDVESKLADASSDATAGIVADYELNQIMLATGEESAEVKGLWSRVNQQNLNVYLLYSAPGLLDEVDSRINKYGMLLAIVKYTPAADQVKIEAKMWNQTSGPVDMDASNFRLVDRAGNSYEATASAGSFKKKATVEMGKESAAGGLTFKFPAGTEPAYLELKASDNRESRKYLP